MEPLLAAMPAVESPEGHVHFKNKLMWTLGILILYFALTNIPLFGLASSSQDVFMAWRALLHGASGSIVHLGIGPIVTASIVLQTPERCRYPAYRHQRSPRTGHVHGSPKDPHSRHDRDRGRPQPYRGVHAARSHHRGAQFFGGDLFASLAVDALSRSVSVASLSF